MKYRPRSHPVTPHFWSQENPHPRQAIEDGVPVIRTWGGRVVGLRDGDAILTTGLPTVFDVMSREKFDAVYEPA